MRKNLVSLPILVILALSVFMPFAQAKANTAVINLSGFAGAVVLDDLHPTPFFPIPVRSELDAFHIKNGDYDIAFFSYAIGEEFPYNPFISLLILIDNDAPILPELRKLGLPFMIISVPDEQLDVQKNGDIITVTLPTTIDRNDIPIPPASGGVTVPLAYILAGLFISPTLAGPVLTFTATDTTVQKEVVKDTFPLPDGTVTLITDFKYHRSTLEINDLPVEAAEGYPIFVFQANGQLKVK